MKAMFINNYPMDSAWKEWKAKKYPGHHLWGATHLEQYGIDLEILPHKKYLTLKRIGNAIKILGDLDQQVRLLFINSQYELIYSGCQYNTFLLSILRSLGVFKKPVIAIVHHPVKSIFKNKFLFKIFYGGHDHFICLNEAVKKQFEDELHVHSGNLSLLEWGVDLQFYENITDNPIVEKEPAFIISAGKSNRDHDTLVKAFLNQDYHLRLYCTGESAPTISELSSNISVHYNDRKKKVISNRELLAEYKKAYAVAIPLNDRNALSGLTSLLDAMAMAKAVIMTRNRYIDIDIEKEGIGIWVEPKDVKGWQQAISYLIEHPSETKEMGNRARRLCEEKYNLDAFSSKLASILKTSLTRLA